MRKLLTWSFFTVLMALLLAPLHSAAQTQFGTVSGRLTDKTGATVPDAKITLTNTATNTKQETKTNADGLFVIGNVSAGAYEISVEKEGFRKTVKRFPVAVAQRVDLDFVLELGQMTETVTIIESTDVMNTISGELATQITSKELDSFPLLTRNPYGLVALAPGASDTGSVTGDARGGVSGIGGGGIAVNGARTSSLNYMLDGGENNNLFLAGVGQVIPLDAMQEFKVQSNATTAEFGRNAVVANVITKSGTNRLHGGLSEYYRGSALSTATFDDKASGTPKSNFVRNDFGASVGGPIIKDKTFYYGSFEGLRIRSSTTNRFFVPTSNFTANATPATNAFLNAFGGLPTSSCADQALTAQQIIVNVEGNATYTGNELRNANTQAIIPASTQLFCRTTLKAPTDGGGGIPGNTWLWTVKVDHRVSASTSLMARYAYQDSKNLDGSFSISPYQGFNTGQTTRNQNANLTLTHNFSPTLYSETRLIYNRINRLNPLGQAPGTTPCWDYASSFSTPTGDQIVFPGYVPASCSFAGIPDGGPQNVYQIYSGMTKSRGRHTFKWGGQYVHIRDNHTFGAYENAFERTNTIQGYLNGTIDRITVAIDPKGKFPGDSYSQAIDGAFAPPIFTRHFHYNELAWYGEDSIKLAQRVTVTAGLRWEYFGVLHSPENERFLDANLFLNAVGSPDLNKPIFAQVRDARFSRTSHLFKSDYKNFGPRIGVAWDVFGNGRTVFRGGYGLYYDRNFGNAVFNVIQNFPNYVSFTLSGTSIAPIRPNQFDTLAALGASIPLVGSARMLDANMRTAYSAQWNATLEHDIFGKGIIATVSYIGTNGYRLYSLNNLNQYGSCVRAPSVNPTCDFTLASRASSGRLTRLNQTGLTGMNRRGNEGLARYNGLSAGIHTRSLSKTGLLISGNYTWSHSLDNESSFFADSALEGFAGFGFSDPYRPSADRSSSSNDIRHRGTISGTWEVPWAKNTTGLARQIAGGWSLSGIFVAQTGGAFSVYDGSSKSICHALDGTDFCYPVATGAAPAMTDTPGTGPNSFVLYGLGSAFQTHDAFCGMPGGATAPTPAQFLCSAQLWQLNPGLLSKRNLFRTPGIWNMDAAVLKDFKMPSEGHRLQFRAEFFNLFNHSNLYVLTGTNLFTGPASQVTGIRGLSPASGAAKERRNIQLALRYIF